MVNLRIIGALLLFSFCANAQLWEFSEPESLKGLSSEYEETAPLLSPDGSVLFFSRIMHPKNQGGKYSGSDIWFSQWDDNKKTWSEANPLEKFNDRANSAVVGISADGNTLYLMRSRSSGKPSGIYFSRKTGNGWTRAEHIPIGDLEPFGFLGFHVSPDFDVIFISMRGADTRGEEDLYVSVKSPNGDWNVPKNLGSSINTKGYEISPFLSADKNRLYFASNGHKGFGDADIFYSDRLYNTWDTWSAPRNLGEKLNSKAFDGYFAIYGDSLAYFSSNRKGKYANIYKVNVVPGNIMLAYGQRYLTSDEMTKVLGANVNRRIVFDGVSTAIRAGDKEVLFYIANKILSDREINVQITALEENIPALTEQRLKAVADEFRASGIENIRLHITNIERFKKKNEGGGIIEISLFK